MRVVVPIIVDGGDGCPNANADRGQCRRRTTDSEMHEAHCEYLLLERIETVECRRLSLFDGDRFAMRCENIIDSRFVALAT
jgi:hypothetical protein